MANAITIDRGTGNGKYIDVLDVAGYLGRTDYGSAVNAIAVMVRQSQLYRDAKEAMRVQRKAVDAIRGDGYTQAADS